MLFGIDDCLLFFGSLSCREGRGEGSDVSLELCLLLFGSTSAAASLSLIQNGSGSRKCFLLSNDFCVLFTFELSADLRLGKSILDIISLFGSLSSVKSHIEGHDLCLDSCHLCSTLVCFLLKSCSFSGFLLLLLAGKSQLLVAVSGIGIAFAFVGVENLFSCSGSVTVIYGSGVVSIKNQLVAIFIRNFGLNVNVNVNVCIDIGGRFLITVHQHVLNTADDVGRVVDQVCNNLYRGKLFRRHGDHIHLALGGDGQKANGNYAHAGSAATAKVFLSALIGFCGQIQATGSNTHRELGNRNNHHTARGNNLLTYNGVRVNNRAYLIQRIPDYFLDRRFVFHNE